MDIIERAKARIKNLELEYEQEITRLEEKFEESTDEYLDNSLIEEICYVSGKLKSLATVLEYFDYEEKKDEKSILCNT